MPDGRVKVPTGNLGVEVFLRFFCAREGCSHSRKNHLCRLEIEQKSFLRRSRLPGGGIRDAKRVVELNHEVSAESSRFPSTSVEPVHRIIADQSMMLQINL